jgi:superkiller protein 3
VDEFLKLEQHLVRLLNRAFDSFESNDIEASAPAFEAILALQPDNAVVCAFTAVCVGRRGRLEEAERLARRSIGLAPELGLTHYVLAIVLIARGEFNEAESALWEAVTADPSSCLFRLELARTLMARDRWDEALLQSQQAVEVSPNEPEALYTLGALQTTARKFELATATIERALELDPNHAHALAIHGYLLTVRADELFTTPPKLAGYKKAVDALRRALALDPSNELAKVHLKMAEDAVERISTPISSWVKTERIDRQKIGQSFILLGMVTLFGLSILLIREFDPNGEQLLTGYAFVLAVELVVFLLILYFKRDFSALPPSLYAIGEKILKRAAREPAAKSIHKL